ncbi:Transmembrane protein 132B, partial [Frankliniella fusca]
AAGTVEVHFENKDGGFFLKQIPRSYPLASAGAAGAGAAAAAAAAAAAGITSGAPDPDQDGDDGGGGVLGVGSPPGAGAGSVLSVDRFTVFQTAEPVSVRASYGPFSTKQTVPARYIVPDPVEQLPGGPPSAEGSSARVKQEPKEEEHDRLLCFFLNADDTLWHRQLMSAQEEDSPLNISALGVARHLDMSAHLVRADVARDQPVLRVLFHTGGDPAARQQHVARARLRQQRVCIVLHASVPGRPPLTAACSPDGEDGVCLAQITIPHTWWPPLPPLPPPEELGAGVGAGAGAGGGSSAEAAAGSEPPPLGLGKAPPRKAPPRVVQLAHSVLEPRASEPGCVPRVQIQPVTPLGTATLVPARSAYRELRADERLTILLPHAALYPLSRMHLPVFLQPRPNQPRVAVLIVKARARPGLRILGAEASSDQWNVSVDMNPKHTVATVTALRRPANIGQDQQEQPSAATDQPATTMPGVSEVFSWLLEVAEDSTELWEDARIVWSVRYVLEGSTGSPGSEGAAEGEAAPEPWPSQQPDLGQDAVDAADAAEAEQAAEPAEAAETLMQADGVATIGGAVGGSVARSRAPRSTHHQGGHHHHQSHRGHHGHHGHHAGHEAHQGHDGHQAHQGHGHAERHHGELVEETRRKLVARFQVQKDDIQAVLPISKNWQLVNTAVLTARQVSQAMKVFIVSQAGRVADVTLQSSCKTEDDSVLKVSSSCTSVYVDGSEIRGSSNGTVLVKYGTYTGVARFTVWMPVFPLEVAVQDYRLSQVKGWRVPDQDANPAKSKRSTGDDVDSWDHSAAAAAAGMVVEDVHNSLEHDRERQSTCRARFQQSPVEVYARFKAEDHDSGRESYFVSRRTLLLVTDLVQGFMRVSDPRIATLYGRVVQGRSSGRTQVQVLSPITGRVIGEKEVRVVTDKVSVNRMLVRVVSGLQLSITADSAIENGYVAETSVTRKLTAQYQEGLLDIDIEFSDGTRTPLREVAVSDYHLMVESLKPDVVAFAPMMASPHPRVIAVREGRGDLLKVTLLPAEACRGVMRRAKPKSITSHVPLAVANAQVEVNFASSDVAQRPEFVQNDGGGMGGSGGKDRKGGRDLPDLQDILIGIPLKDENNHEPTVQARQHSSSGGGGGLLGGLGKTAVVAAGPGPRHHGNVHTTPLEIGMYVLLAAFCFAIVVFVVSCVVYASKFSPQQPLDQLAQTAPQVRSRPRLPRARPRPRARAPRLDPHLHARLDNRLDPRLDPRSQPRLDPHAHPRLDSHLDPPAHPRLDPHLDPRSHPRLDPRSQSRLDPPAHLRLDPHLDPLLDPRLDLCAGKGAVDAAVADSHGPVALQGVGGALGRPQGVSGMTGLGVAMVKRQLQPQSRDSTTNVHDWVWLGRATLERGSTHPATAPATSNSSARSGPPLNINSSVMHITTNPNYADPTDVTEEMELAIAECLSKPERVVNAEPVVSSRIDSSTYCKKDRDKDRSRDRERRGEKRHHHHRGHKSSQEINPDGWKLIPPPPPLPAHGSSPEKRGPLRDEDPEYKPPVPPHRNIPLMNDDEHAPAPAPPPAPVQPRRHHHHHHSHNHSRNNVNSQGSSNNSQKEQSRHTADEEDDLPDPTFVEFPEQPPGPVQLQGSGAEVKRANIVGNPMFSSTEEEDDDEDEDDQGEVQRVREELLGLDDLNMDYDQIMEYFDNLKESNA